MKTPKFGIFGSAMRCENGSSATEEVEISDSWSSHDVRGFKHEDVEQAAMQMDVELERVGKYLANRDTINTEL